MHVLGQHDQKIVLNKARGLSNPDVTVMQIDANYNTKIQSSNNIILDASTNIISNVVGINKQTNLAPSSYAIALDVSGVAFATSFNTSSDYRIKENIRMIEDTVDHLRPVSYYNTLTRRQELGFIAHELQECFPFLVLGNKHDVQHQYIEYTGLVALLTKEIQGLKLRIKHLQHSK